MVPHASQPWSSLPPFVTSFWSNEVLLAWIIMSVGQDLACHPRDFEPVKRSPARLDPRAGRTRSSLPPSRLRFGRTKSCLLESSCRTDEVQLASLVTSFQSDEVPLAWILMPVERGPICLPRDFVPIERSPTRLDPCARWMSSSLPPSQLRSGWTKSTWLLLSRLHFG